MIREQGLPFRPDWEAVVTPVVDFALTLSEVDGDRLALMGMSLGGYLAPRAAAFEYRIKALVAFDGVYAIGTGGDDDYYRAMRADIGLDWMLRNGMWTLGVDSPAKVADLFTAYHLRGIAESITAPTLVLAAEHDHFLTGQP